MKKKILHYLKEILLFLITITLFANLMSWYKSQDLTKDKLPSISTKLINNIEYTLPKNEAIMVHIWATWCPTCKLEAKNIEMISTQYEVITIAVNSGTDLEIKNYLDENGLDMNVINDKNSIYAKKFNISAYPTTFIYDKSGDLVFSEVGYTSTLGLFLRMWWANL